MNNNSMKLKNFMQIEVLIGVFIIVGGMVIGILFRKSFKDFEEIRDADVIGTYGTIYALIAAFILVEAWNHYNEIKTTYSAETEALIHLWNFVDFLDDETMSKAMHFTLLSYIDTTLKVEFPKLARFQKVHLPSPEFQKILHLLDMIDFEKSRTGVAFDAMVTAFKDLSHARNQRIEFSLNRIPGLVKFFYVLASGFFWIAYLIQYFDNVGLYYFILFSTTVTVVISYLIIFDLDKPLQGLIQISLENYEVCRQYIKETIHSV
ncbi:MAG: bestrophin-like domain [Candidatus Kariarchaeaceae archaeon]